MPVLLAVLDAVAIDAIFATVIHVDSPPKLAAFSIAVVLYFRRPPL